MKTQKITPAVAKKLRAKARKLCGCNRCAYASRDVESPALTFAEYESRRTEWAAIVQTRSTHREWADLTVEARRAA